MNGIWRSRRNGDVGFVGENTPSAAGTQSGAGSAVGATGSYQGYAPGMGLENSPGLLKWMFQQRDVRSQSDTILLQTILNGDSFQVSAARWGDRLGRGRCSTTYENRDAFDQRHLQPEHQPLSVPAYRRSTGYTSGR